MERCSGDRVKETTDIKMIFDRNARFSYLIPGPYAYQILFLSPLVPAGSAWVLTLDVGVGLLAVWWVDSSAQFPVLVDGGWVVWDEGWVVTSVHISFLQTLK